MKKGKEYTTADGSKFTVIGNGHWREPVSFWDLPPSIAKSEFDYAKDEDGYERFICYRGMWYDLADGFEQICFGASRGPAGGLRDTLRELGWQAMRPDSYFSGTVIRYDEDGGRIQIATVIV